MGWGWEGGARSRGGSRRAHQELALLLPVVALCVGGRVGLGHHADELPLLLAGLHSLPHRLLQLLPAAPLAVLLDQLPLGQPLVVVQHHWSGEGRGRDRGHEGGGGGGEEMQA